MRSIGPQLPPHLQKRKRTPEDEAKQTSPPPKLPRREEDLEDGGSIGPKLPASAQIGPSIGPQLPPSIGPSLPSDYAPRDQSKSTSSKGGAQTAHSVAKTKDAKPKRAIGPTRPPPPPTNEDEISLDADSDSDVGPAPPAARIGPTFPPAVAAAQKRVMGPAPPPANLAERPTTGPHSDSDSDDDDDDDNWGPALPSATASRSSGPTLPSGFASHADQEPAALKRDDWMTAPPTDSSYRAPDPTKLKSRKFASGPRAAGAASDKPGGISSIWTETPEEKLRRLTNAVLGREDPSASSGPSVGAQGFRSGTSAAAAAASRSVDEARVRSYTEQTRGRSLVEEHQAAKAAGKTKKAGDVGGQEADEDDDPSKRAFDREKDMAIGGRLNNSTRRELLTRAADFGGRFQKGNYL